MIKLWSGLEHVGRSASRRQYTWRTNCRIDWFEQKQNARFNQFFFAGRFQTVNKIFEPQHRSHKMWSLTWHCYRGKINFWVLLRKIRPRQCSRWSHIYLWVLWTIDFRYKYDHVIRSGILPHSEIRKSRSTVNTKAAQILCTTPRSKFYSVLQNWCCSLTDSNFLV